MVDTGQIYSQLLEDQQSMLLHFGIKRNEKKMIFELCVVFKGYFIRCLNEKLCKEDKTS